MKYLGILKNRVLPAEKNQKLSLYRGDILGPLPQEAFEELRKHLGEDAVELSPAAMSHVIKDAYDVKLTEVASSIRMFPCPECTKPSVHSSRRVTVCTMCNGAGSILSILDPRPPEKNPFDVAGSPPRGERG